MHTPFPFGNFSTLKSIFNFLFINNGVAVDHYLALDQRLGLQNMLIQSRQLNFWFYLFVAVAAYLVLSAMGWFLEFKNTLSDIFNLFLTS